MAGPPRVSLHALHRELNELLKGRYTRLIVEAEVGQIQTPPSGHAYILLRDRDRFGNDAQLGAVMWRDDWRNSRFKPQVGDRVMCRGRLGVYPARGQVQLYVSAIARAGEGKLAAEIARRKAKLLAEGLLDERRKRALPPFPRFVGVATSLSGAALQDFLKVSRERFPAARILVAGCQVQGDTAAGTVIQALDLLAEDGRSEVIVVTRGGGSSEDLLAFQDEWLARAIAHCPVPVISAVGHEIDTSLADLVADAVAPTPSAAAMLALPDATVWEQRIDEAALALELGTRRAISQRRERVTALSARMRHPAARLTDARRRAQELRARLDAAITRRLRAERDDLTRTSARIAPAASRALTTRRERLTRLSPALHPAIRRALTTRRRTVDALSLRNQALSPLAVLDRGYAIVRGPAGVVHAAAELAAGDRVQVRVADGEFGATVD